jgi:hypothetical protein
MTFQKSVLGACAVSSARLPVGNAPHQGSRLGGILSSSRHDQAFEQSTDWASRSLIEHTDHSLRCASSQGGHGAVREARLPAGVRVSQKFLSHIEKGTSQCMLVNRLDKHSELAVKAAEKVLEGVEMDLSRARTSARLQKQQLQESYDEISSLTTKNHRLKVSTCRDTAQPARSFPRLNLRPMPRDPFPEGTG